MKFKLDKEDLKEVKGIQYRVETNSKQIENIINEIITPYCKGLDDYVTFIKDVLSDGEKPPTDIELEDFCMNLGTHIYFAGSMVEQLGIKDDISKAVYKEMYHSSRASLDKGTVADKDSLAELESQKEYLINVCYNRAFRILKAKVENAQELLQSVKKVLSRRMQELELTRLQ